MYARTVNGRVLTFGVSGKLVRNSLIMYDRETNTLWSHLTGGALEGPLKGTELEVIPSTQTTWSAWRRAHPATKVLPHDYLGEADSYIGYFRSSAAGILGRKRDDRRLPGKAKVVGIRVMDRPKAYSVDALVRAGVINDTFDGVPLVVVKTGSDSASVFQRDVAGRILTFQVATDGSLTDQETRSRWDPVAGTARSGPLTGTSMTPVPATESFWFGWFDFFPGTALYPEAPPSG